MATVRPTVENDEDKGGIDGCLSSRLLRKVADTLGKDWKRLGRDMDLPETKIESIEVTYPGNLNEMAYQVLIAWKQKVGHKANFINIQNHLESIDRNDIVATISIILHPEFYNHASSEDVSSLTVDSVLSVIMLRFWDTKVMVVSRSGMQRVFQEYIVYGPGTMEPDSDLLTEVQDKLMEQYMALRMTGLPWMHELAALTLEEYYVDLSITKMDKNGMEIPPESINIDEIFLSTDSSKKLLRILVEGGPGMGKSTLAAKLAYDWANRQRYIKHFDLVALIPLRHLVGGLRDMICSSVPIKEQDCTHMLKIFGDISKNILFVMDGYDEISPEIEAVILPILQRKVYSHTTVIVTSRPGKFPTIRAEVDVTRQINADFSPTFSHFIQKRVSLKGFSPSQQITFVKKHTKTCSEQEKQTIMLKLNKLVDKDFLKCPLFLLMLIVTFTANYDTDNPSENKTELYKQVFNCVIKRYFSKMKYETLSEIDLFSYTGRSKPPHIELMEEFSKFSLWAIRLKQFSFIWDEVIKHTKCDPRILELGFLTQSVTVKRLRMKSVHEPVHKSLLEFAAAYGLWLTFTDQNAHSEQWKKDVVSIRPEDESSLCFFFLVGLMRENADSLFNPLLPYKFFYSFEFISLYPSLVEIEMNESTIKSLSPFLPVIWQIKWENNDSEFSFSDNHKSIVQYGIHAGKIKQIV